jgi:DNA modification methylase
MMDITSTFEHTIFDDGLVICGDCTDQTIFEFVKKHIAPGKFAAIITDPPYGNILDDAWDKTKLTQQQFSDWMTGWFKIWLDLLPDGGAFYVWGGIGEVSVCVVN